MAKKKTLLISWPAHMFREIMVPLVEDLASNFEIVMTTIDYYVPDGLISEFEDMKYNGMIKSYFIVPNFPKVKQQYQYLKKNTQKLKSYEFDLWLTGSEMQINERYIKEFILPSKCITIVLWHGITYLFESPDIANELLHNDFQRTVLMQEDGTTKEQMFLESFRKKIKESGGYTRLIRKLPASLFWRTKILFKILFRNLRRLSSKKRILFQRYKKKIGQIYGRVILPWLMTGKTFYYKPLDKLTQLGSGDANVLLFTDPLEVQAHKILYDKDEIHEVQYPSYGNCWCGKRVCDTKDVLSMLSGMVGSDTISENYMKLFLRDFQIVLNETKAECFHLRLHPRETGNWPYQLCDFLLANDIPVQVVGFEKTIREIMCNYLGVAGFNSMALRDARACCDYGFVVGFEAVSKSRYVEPKFVYGMGEGIGWINEDGSYDPAIFEKKKYIPPKRKTVPEILNELSVKQDLALSK